MTFASDSRVAASCAVSDCVVVARLGTGVPIETPMYPKLVGAQPLARIAEETLPKMLAPGESDWKAAAARLAERV